MTREAKEYKTALTPHERIKVAFLHYVRGINQHDLATAFEVNPGRVATACKAVWDAVKDGEEDRPEDYQGL